MKCADCLYYWKDEPDEVFPSCHFIYSFPGECAPCEVDEYESEFEEEEY